jgi:menaquinol-cytochrome c reductase iron-sulfur subunit
MKHAPTDDEAPAGAPADPPEVLVRRRLLARVSIGLSALSAFVLGIPIVGFIVSPIFRRTTPTWRVLGVKDSFKIGETVNVVFEDASPLLWAGVTAKTAAWLRRVSDDEFVAFSVNCAHLGCPVRWMQTADLFMCPCHGGVYYADGSVAAGPPPHGLTRYPVRVRDGAIEIRTDPIPIG